MDGFLTYVVTPAAGLCNIAGSGGVEANAACVAPFPEFVEVYQPLTQGDGQIWAVHQVAASYPGSTMSVVADQHVRDGASIVAKVSPVQDVSFATLGYGSCDQYASVVAAPGDVTEAAGTGYGLALDVQLGDRCQGFEQGYAWVATASQPLIPHSDPILHRASDAPVLNSLTVVPVVMVFPSTVPSATTAPSTTASAQVDWTPYTDALGWTVDVPNGWTTQIWPGAGAGFSGDGITVEITRGGEPLVRDDSSFPLDPKGFLFRGEGALIGKFYGDGLPFGFIVMGDETNPPDLTPDQRAIVDHMIESISMEPWRLGETRNGLTAIAKILPYATADWIVFDGKYYISYYGGDGGRVVLGPAPACRGQADGTYEVRETGDAGISCKDGEHGDWDFATGKPASSNTPLFAVALPSTAAALAWDEHLLVRSSAKSTPSPTPS